MKKQKIIISVVAIAIVLIAGYLLKNPSKSVNIEPIKVGFIAPLSGGAVTFGVPLKNAASLAIEEINNSGGIDGRQIEIIYEDGKCTGKDALSAVQKLVNIDNVKIIVNAMCTGGILSVAPIIEENEILLFSAGSAGLDVVDAGDFIFHNGPSEIVGAETLAKEVMKNNKKIAIISGSIDYSVSLKNALIKNIEDLGGTIIIDESYVSDTNDFRAILAKIKSANPDALIINPHTEIAGGTIVKQARELGIDAGLFGAPLLAGSKSIELAGIHADGLRVIIAPELDKENSLAKEFLRNYKDRYGETTLEFFLAATYDMVYILKQAVEKVGEDSEQIRDYLYNIKNYNGVVGKYHFDENGNMSGIDYFVKEIKI
ncbi:ABC transporter substrate-binding protein [Candidatus Woesearchaeota archaeon]|jgi:branched-chain amino acid transport system substrate-binding protein|nr:ABC transporter substrate-binding protein [bacterium]MBT4207380.1 ABC transporter substrate-binding protein [Candidatus Woesearchaeota archaeon]MBT4731489.1 ABC transporter substrate-binding protein [Candidatus Woesearchaeota archaeon]